MNCIDFIVVPVTIDVMSTTTLTIDRGVADQVRELARKADTNVQRVASEAVRIGLDQMRAMNHPLIKLSRGETGANPASTPESP